MESIYTASVMVNTRGKGCPTHLTKWLQELYFDTQKLIVCSNIFNMDRSIVIWQGHVPELTAKDTLIQCVFRLTEKLGQTDLEHYVSRICKDYVYPYLSGCGFTYAGPIYQSILPPDFFALATGGEKTLAFTSFANPIATIQILIDVFQQNLLDAKIGCAILQSQGYYKIPTKLPAGNVEKLVELLEAAGIEDYEITTE